MTNEVPLDKPGMGDTGSPLGEPTEEAPAPAVEEATAEDVEGADEAPDASEGAPV